MKFAREESTPSYLRVCLLYDFAYTSVVVETQHVACIWLCAQPHDTVTYKYALGVDEDSDTEPL